MILPGNGKPVLYGSLPALTRFIGPANSYLCCMRLIIKNMVCPRCITSVEEILKKNKLETKVVRLGEVKLMKAPTPAKLEQFAEDLKQTGFELLDDQKMQLIEKVKNLLIRKVQSGNIEDDFTISRYITDNIYKDYSSISRLFSGVEGVTIE